MIGNSMLGRVIAVALVFGASTPLMAQDYGRDRGHEEDEEEVRRVGRRGREDGESASEEAHERNAEREAQREAEWLQRQEGQQRAEQDRQAEQQQRELERQAQQQQREQAQAYEQQQRDAAQEQRRAEREQRQQAQAEEQRRVDAAEYERQVQQQEAEQQRGQRVRERDQSREAWGMQQERERQASEQSRQAELQQRDYNRGRQRPIEVPIEVQRGDATDELQRLERERYQVERGGNRERYEDFRGDREGRRGDESRPEWRDRDQVRDAQSWGDPRRRWNTDGRQVPTPRDGARLSERERQSLYTQQRQFADRYRRDYPRHIESWEHRSRGLQSQRRLEQYHYQQRYWQRHRDYHSRWNSHRWSFDRDPFFWTGPSHRYYRGGRWYDANRYAVDVLQQAIRIGYEEGFYAGEADRHDGWRGGYRDNFVYQDASLGYQGWYVSHSEYNYYFREGFRRGYEDGYYRRFRYGRRYDTGYSILPRELDVILRLELYR